MAKQKITIEDLAHKVDGATKSVEDLAIITKRGFDATQEENKKDFKLVRQDIEDLKLRQDNVAYRFELNALGERVTKLEKSR